jgi:Flp pilus assembly protein TadD
VSGIRGALPGGLPNFEAGRQLYLATRYDLAEPYLRAALLDNPLNANAHAMLAYCVGRRKLRTEAMAEAREAVRLAPNEAFSHVTLGLVLQQARWWPESIAAFKAALRLSPGDPSHLASLAHSLTMSGKPSEALEMAEEALRRDPSNLSALNERGLALLGLRRVVEARESIGSALVSQPDSSSLHSNLGIPLLQQGLAREAAAEFEEALRLDPKNAAAEQNLVLARRSRGGVGPGRLHRAVTWWAKRPPRVQIVVIASFALGSIVWAGFLSPAICLLSLSVTSRLASWGMEPPGWRRRIALATRPLALPIVVVGQIGPALVSVVAGHPEWGLGAGLTLTALLALAIAEPSGVTHWIAAGSAVFVGIVGILTPIVGFPPWITVVLGFGWVLLYVQVPSRAFSRGGVDRTPTNY